MVHGRALDRISIVNPPQMGAAKPEARFVKFTTFNRPNEAPGMRLGLIPGLMWKVLRLRKRNIPSHIRCYGDLWQTTAQTEWGTRSFGSPLEIRIQKHQIHRSY